MLQSIETRFRICASRAAIADIKGESRCPTAEVDSGPRRETEEPVLITPIGGSVAAVFMLKRG
jgi:hypothetical protein